MDPLLPCPFKSERPDEIEGYTTEHIRCLKLLPDDKCGELAVFAFKKDANGKKSYIVCRRTKRGDHYYNNDIRNYVHAKDKALRRFAEME